MNKTYFCILNCTENQAIYLFYCAPFVCIGLVFAQRLCVCVLCAQRRLWQLLLLPRRRQLNSIHFVSLAL